MGTLLAKSRNKAYLVILQTRPSEPSFFSETENEMRELARAALVQVVGVTHAKIFEPSPSQFIREGKLLEVIAQVKKCGANSIVFNVDLTPVQARNLEKKAKVPMVDRTGLILDIFGRRAKSREGHLQVELARLNYMLPRLGGLGTVMSRLGGGVGTRGPGEQELERDRRKIRGRIERVKDELKKVKKHRELLRQGRKRKQLVTVALVGYTNAGKSTLLNTLTGADAYVEDKMFATLDPKIRAPKSRMRPDLLFVDTVGFLRELPHDLIESFHATLEEVSEADLLIHVLDASHPRAEELYQAVLKVLEELQAASKPMILALNKMDLTDALTQSVLRRKWPHAILISAKKNMGVEELLNQIEEKCPRKSPLPAWVEKTASFEKKDGDEEALWASPGV